MPLRVLALCGFGQNAQMFANELAPVVRLCKDVEFVFLEPPVILQPTDLPWDQRSRIPESNRPPSHDKNPEHALRAWWVTNDDWSHFKYFDQTLAYVHNYLANSEPFDGIFGFSQGAVMAAFLAALLEKPGTWDVFPSEPAIPRFQFCIFVSGFHPIASVPFLRPLFPLPETSSTLHIRGRSDTSLTPEQIQTLMDVCLNKRVEVHDGGHYCPTKPKWRLFFRDYITSFLPGGSVGKVPAPSSYGQTKLASSGREEHRVKEDPKKLQWPLTPPISA